jgi:hypothetical protein
MNFLLMTLLQSRASALWVICNGTRGKSSPPWKLWLKMQPNPRHRMATTPTTQYPFICNALYQIFLCFGNGIAILQGIALENLVMGMSTWICWNTKVWLKDGSVGHCTQTTTLWLAFHCCSKKPTSSNTKTFSRERFVPIFTSHTFGRFGQSNTYFFFVPFTQQLMSSTYQIYVAYWLLGRNSFKSLNVGKGVPYLLFPTLTLHGCLKLVCKACHGSKWDNRSHLRHRRKCLLDWFGGQLDANTRISTSYAQNFPDHWD